MGIVCENANFHGIGSDFTQRIFFCPQEKEIGGVQKTNQGASVLVLRPNAPVTCEVRSRAAIARLSHLTVNTATAVTLTGRH